MRMPTGPRGAIHKDRPLLRVEPVNDFIEQDRLVNGLGQRFRRFGIRIDFGRHDELVRCLGASSRGVPETLTALGILSSPAAFSPAWNIPYRFLIGGGGEAA